MNDERPASPIQQARNCGYVLMFICRVLAVPLETILHKRMGVNAVGASGLAALLLVLVWPGFYPDCDPRPMLWFGAVVLVMCFVRRMGALRRAARGEHEHTRYSGWPVLKRLLPRCSELTFKRGVEPLLVFIASMVTLPFNEPLGSYLFYAAIALAVSVNVTEAAEQARAMELNDVLIAQRQTAERLRRMQGERW